MKKLLYVVLLLSMLCVCAFAEGMNISLSHDSTNLTVLAEISMSDGGATLGHFGVSYNTEKLQPVTHDLTALPSELPQTAEDSKTFLPNVVKPLADYITVTSENNKANELVNTEKGFILFGWYASKEIDAVVPEKDGGKIALITFKIKDGYSISDIGVSDIKPVTKDLCSSISGWSAGIVISGLDKVYTYESADESKSLNVTVTLEFAPEEETNTEKKEETPENPVIPEKENPTDDTSAEQKPAEESDKTTENNNTAPVVPEQPKEDFGVKATAYSDKIKITWKNNPSLSGEYGYRIIITDKDGDTVRDIKGILPVCRSVTVKDLVPNFDFTVNFYLENSKTEALTAHTETISVKTAIDTKAQPKIFKVRYKVGNGTLYGIDNEDVMFGHCPTKASTTVYPYGHYKFEGWSVDGKTVIDVSKYKIYEDTVFTAVYSKLEASGNSY